LEIGSLQKNLEYELDTNQKSRNKSKSMCYDKPIFDTVGRKSEPRQIQHQSPTMIEEDIEGESSKERLIPVENTHKVTSRSSNLDKTDKRTDFNQKVSKSQIDTIKSGLVFGYGGFVDIKVYQQHIKDASDDLFLAKTFFSTHKGVRRKTSIPS
jgi:hypothetical protein